MDFAYSEIAQGKRSAPGTSSGEERNLKQPEVVTSRKRKFENAPRRHQGKRSAPGTSSGKESVRNLEQPEVVTSRKRKIENAPRSDQGKLWTKCARKDHLSPYSSNHKAAMSLGLCRMISLVVLIIATVLFTGLYNYQEEILKMATIIVPAKTTTKRVVSFTNEGTQTTWQNQKLDGSPDVCGKEWQSRYQALHQDIINNKREAKFLVYFCDRTILGCFGYGDRVRAVISLFYLAILTDRAFLIHWKAPKSLERFLTPKNINWTFPIPLLETRKHFWRNIYGQRKKDLDGWQTKNSSAVVNLVKRENFKVFFDKPVEIVTSNVYFAEGAMQENKYLMQRAREMEISPLLPGSRGYANIGCAFDVLFDTPPRLQNALQNTRKKLRENSTFVIGIHIRLGDKQFGRNNTRVSESDFPKYFLCAEKVERKLFNLDGRKHARWFLATDSLLVKDYARKHFAEKVITEKYKPEHLDFFKEGEKPLSDEGMMGLLHDHFMLAECDFLVLSRSSFSWTAAGVGMHSSKTYTFGENCSLKF